MERTDRVKQSDLSRFDLSGRTAVVTGGSRGLGKAMALGLARAGADVVLVGRSRETLEAAVAEFRSQGLSAEGIPADVSDVNSIRELFRQVANLYEGKLDILINAAGINIRKPATEYTEAEWDAILNTNLKGTFFCCQEAGKLMIPRKYGRIINVGSLTSSIGIATIAPYGATKMGVVAIAKTLAVEWGTP
ncbi:MAG: hypothetical protein KatS3mg115_2392 [Candidatus Poribacteria bacterium]|nr:MAG: hypothetical protein KatS3mg115_2392 [Candidatus Poribacteria bacterium]